MIRLLILLTIPIKRIDGETVIESRFRVSPDAGGGVESRTSSILAPAWRFLFGGFRRYPFLSGIVGMFHRNNAPVDAPLLHALTQSLACRSSDDNGVWVQGPVGFGHALPQTTWESRDKKQPASLDGEFWLTADARLDDRCELIRQLRDAGGKVSDLAPDTELILLSYRSWGPNCLDNLRGDFAFALWDVRAKTLFCARDHFGIKPFYFTQQNNLFLFSNTLDCIRTHPAISEELNDSAIADFLLFGLNFDQSTTSFREVQRLAPAHCLTVSADAFELRQYWTPPINGHIRYRRDEEYVEHFQSLLESAVKDRLRADRVGILLSGGMDSTSLAATAREISKSSGATDIYTYTALYESLIVDGEASHASEVANFLGVPNRRIAMDHLQPFTWPGDSNHTLPDPPDNPFFGALFEQFSVIAKDCGVLISGEGNDNLMYFQMWPYIQELKRKNDWKRLLREVPQYLRVRPFPWRGIRAQLTKSLSRNPGRSAILPWIEPDFARRMNLEQRWREGSELLMPITPHPVRPKAHASLGLPHWASMFENENSGVTRYPVDVRYPFLDLRIMEYLLALPPFPWFFQKALLRKAMEGKLPESVRVRPKTPFRGDPLLAYFRRDGVKRPIQVLPNVGLDRYINREALPQLHGSMEPEQVISATRPHCLNFWLQSLRSSDPSRVLRVETGNG
jgi:asparagine synthase (glutamine-hydrolysing)